MGSGCQLTSGSLAWCLIMQATLRDPLIRQTQGKCRVCNASFDSASKFRTRKVTQPETLLNNAGIRAFSAAGKKSEVSGFALNFADWAFARGLNILFC